MIASEEQAVEHFFSAIGAGEVATVESLVTSNPALLETRSPAGLRPMIVAAYSGATAVVQVLIELGVELDVFEAAALGAIPRLHAVLAAHPALVHAYSADGWTALHLAGHFGQSEAAQVLLDGGADLGALSHNRNGNTPLHAALAGRQTDTVRFLIERGADVTVADAAGYTPLHLAAHEGNVALVRMLLSAGADPRAQKADGQTPLNLAEAERHQEVANLVRAYV